MLGHFLVTTVISDKKSAIIRIVFPIGKVVFLSAFKIFFFVFSFQSLTMMCLGMDFFGFILFRFTEFLASIGLCLLPNLRYSAIIYLNSFSAPPFFSFPSSDMNVRFFFFLIVHRSLLFCSFFSSVYFLSVFQIG